MPIAVAALPGWRPPRWRTERGHSGRLALSSQSRHGHKIEVAAECRARFGRMSFPIRPAALALELELELVNVRRGAFGLGQWPIAESQGRNGSRHAMMTLWLHRLRFPVVNRDESSLKNF
jgi:hypothetical protein